jgi:hypothetical protein
MRKSVGATVGMVNSLHVCGRWIFWTLATMKCGSTLGIGFLAQSSSRSESFLLLLSTTMMVLEGLMLANIGFLGHLLLLLSTTMMVLEGLMLANIGFLGHLLLLLSTTMMVLEGLMLANIGFLGHLLLLLSTIMIGS